ncbi:MAG: DUF6249 domain-containing protein [Chitinophagales bacterium]
MGGQVLEMLVVFISAIVVPVCVFGYILYKKRKYNHEERMRMIEKGMRPDTKKEEPVTEKQKHKSLESGVFFTAVAIGLLIGYLLKEGLGMDSVLAFFISIPLFVGLGNVGLYLFLKKDKEEKNAIEE